MFSKKQIMPRHLSNAFDSLLANFSSVSFLLHFVADMNWSYMFSDIISSRFALNVSTKWNCLSI